MDGLILKLALGHSSMKQILIYVIRIYQMFSSFTPPCCRFMPTCSHYTVQAIESHGVFQGSWLGLKRLCRCHPLSAGGFDPPPTPVNVAS